MKEKIILVFIFLLFVSCGQSPLQKKISNVSSGKNTLEANKIFKTTNQELKLNWLTNINTSEEGKILLILNQNGKIQDADNVTLGAFLWMKSMGHGSSPISITKLAPGIYQLTEIFFSMTGNWQLHLTLNQNGKSIEDLEYNLELTE